MLLLITEEDYAPVFFINGAIKGTDLFYRHTTKSFVPLNERWVEYLISLSESSEGKGVPISERINTRRQLNLQAVVSPPDVMMARKYASAAWAEIKSAALTELPKESILRKFIVQDGGFSAIQKIANAAKENPEFAQALFLASSAENYMPELEPPAAPEPPTPVLTLHLQPHKNAHVKSATTQELSQGYVFEDQRPKAALNEVIYEAAERNLRSVTEPGIYSVLTFDGTQREMLCAYHKHLLPGGHYLTGSQPLAEAMLPFSLIDLGDHQTKDLDLLHHDLPATQVLGKFERDLAATDGQAVPAAGQMYRVLNLKTRSLSECFYVDSVDQKELGQTQVKLQNRWHDHADTLTLNPDYDGCDLRAKVLGKGCVWVPVKSETKAEGDYQRHEVDESIALGDPHALDNLIYESGFAKAAVQKSGQDFVVRLHAEQANAPAALLSKLAAKAALMTHCALDEATTDQVLSQAAERRYIFHYEPAEKKAHNLRFPQFPEFYDTMNSDYNVQEQPQPSHIMVQAEKTQPYIEKHRIGDMMRFDAADNGIDTATPMDLYNLSQERGVGKMFEHGVVGALTNTFDSAALIETYMPDLQTALDRIGRVLFLFYWKPEDFATAFGSDDQSQLENKLVSNFKSFGDLVMELLQKNKQNEQGSVGLT